MYTKFQLDAWILADPYVRIKGSHGQELRLSEASSTDLCAHEKLVDEFVNFVINNSEMPELRPAQELLARSV